MRRTVAALTLSVLCAFTVVSCSEAKKLVDSAGCKGLQAASSALPATDAPIPDSAIKALGTAAKTVQSALNALPTDKLPSGAQAKVDEAITNANDAASKIESDPQAAQDAAKKAVASLQDVISKAETSLSCSTPTT